MNLQTAITKKSPILNWFELSQDQQKQVINLYNDNDYEDQSFCLFDSEPLPLNMFIRSEPKNKFYDGVFGLTYFSGYFIKLGSTGENCLITYSHW